MATVKNLRKPTREEKSKILEAAGTGDFHSIQVLANRGIDVTGSLDVDQWTALHMAARYGHYNVVAYLLSHGARVNDVDNVQWTALHEAARYGHYNVVAYLLSHGARVNDVDNDQWTALHLAAWYGHYNVVAYLLSHGARVNDVTNLKNTPLHYAASNGHVQIVDLLVNYKASVSMKNNYNRTPLQEAVVRGKSQVVEYFINQVKMDISKFDDETQDKIRRLLEEAETSRKDTDGVDQHAESPDPQESELRMGLKKITKRTILAYQLAMKTGTRKSNQLKLVMMGAEGAGKTSSVSSLLDKKFEDDEKSTVGASLNCCLTDRIFVSRWQQILIAEQLDNLPKLHKSNIKSLMPKMSPQVDKELDLSMSKAEEVPDVVAAHVQECVNAKEVSDGDVRIVILDLGGQEIYYEVHFLFLAPEDIVLLTFDASKGLDQPVICRQRLDRFQEKVATRGMQTNLEMLETLFQSVYSHCGRAAVGYISNRIPTIIMMATHSKGLTDQQKSAIKCQFCKHFCGKPFFDHLPRAFEDAFHFIDNKFRDPEAFERVKHVVLKASKNSIEQECPISYLQFETKLLEASEDKPIISLQEVRDIATAAGIEQDKLTEVLLHYSYKGVLLYYPDVAALQQEVFVHPQEVSDLVSSVISTHDCQPSSADLNNSCKRYDTYGLLEECLLDDLLKRCGRLQQKETILALLQKFDLAVEVPVSTKFFDEDDGYKPPNSGRVFVVPSMLVYNKRNVYQKQDGDVVVLFHYPDKFLSENIFNHLLVRAIIWCNKEGHHIRRIYRGNGYFNFKSRNQSFKLQECQATSSIKCYITVHKKNATTKEEETMLAQCQALLAHLKKSIIEVHEVYIPSARHPIAYIECPLHHKENCGPHVRLEDISETEDVYCSKSDGEVVPPEAYMMLLSTNTGIDHQSMTPLKDPKVAVASSATISTHHLLDTKPDVWHIISIVIPEIKAKWEYVAFSMQYSIPAVNAFKKDSSDCGESCFNLFKDWLSTSHGVTPKTWRTLLNRIKDVDGLQFVVKDIERKIIEKLTH